DPPAPPSPERWPPRPSVDATGTVVTQPFVGAQWQHVTPFALTKVAQLRSPTAPAGHGTQAYGSQARALLAISAGLTDEQKMIAEYWAHGHRPELPPAHWDLFAQSVSRRDPHGAHKHGSAAAVDLSLVLPHPHSA